jgi:hypothetical protein
MRKSFDLGHIAGLRITAHPSVIAAGLILWLILAVIGLTLLNLSLVESVIGGLVAALLHYLSELVHQLGHAWAARRTGHPMIGVRYWMVLGASIYPKDEGDLPASIHIRRALGGAPASLLLAMVAGILVLALQAMSGTVLWWLAVFLFLDNLLVFTLGAFLPLGFTDGSTLLQWWGK